MSTDRIEGVEKEVMSLRERFFHVEELLKLHKESCPAPGVKTSCEEMIENISERINSRDKVLGRFVGIVFALTLVFAGSIMTMQSQKVSKDDFKDFKVAYMENESKRDLQIEKSIIDQLSIQRNLLTEMTQIKVSLGEMAAKISVYEQKMKEKK